MSKCNRCNINLRSLDRIETEFCLGCSYILDTEIKEELVARNKAEGRAWITNSLPDYIYPGLCGKRVLVVALQRNSKNYHLIGWELEQLDAIYSTCYDIWIILYPSIDVIASTLAVLDKYNPDITIGSGLAKTIKQSAVECQPLVELSERQRFNSFKRRVKS